MTEPVGHGAKPSGPDVGGPRAEIVYVSWGGTGRAAALRRAMGRAHDTGRGLVYLAILDDSSFGDIDQSVLALAKDELSWLLDAQLELTKQQTGVDDVPVRVLVRTGDVVEVVAAVVDEVVAGSADDTEDEGGDPDRRTEVLIGAPVPTSDHATITDLIDAVSARVAAPVSLVEP